MDGFGRHHNMPEFLRQRKLQPKHVAGKSKHIKSRLALQEGSAVGEIDTPRLFEPNFGAAFQSDEVPAQHLDLGFSDRNLVPDTEVIQMQRELLASREKLHTRENGKEVLLVNRGLLSRESKMSGKYRTLEPIKPNHEVLPYRDTVTNSVAQEPERHKDEVSFAEKVEVKHSVKKPTDRKLSSPQDNTAVRRPKLDIVNETVNDQHPSASLHEPSHEQLPTYFEAGGYARQSPEQQTQHNVDPAFNGHRSDHSIVMTNLQKKQFKEKRTKTAGIVSSPTKRSELNFWTDDLPNPVQQKLKVFPRSKLTSNLPSMKNLHSSMKPVEQNSPQLQREFGPFKNQQKKYGLQPSSSEPALKVKQVSSHGDEYVYPAVSQQLNTKSVYAGVQLYFGGEPMSMYSKPSPLETSLHVPNLGKPQARLLERWVSDLALPTLTKQSHSDNIRHNLGELPRLVDRRIADKIIQENKQLRSVVARDNMIIGMLTEKLFV